MSEATSQGFDTVIFDLGGVVLTWDPRRAYAQVLPADQIDAFMTTIDFSPWNIARDAGADFAVGEQELIELFPDRAEAVLAYRTHFAHTLTGMVPGTGAVIAELQRAGVRLVGLSNWSAETFPVAEERFGLLRRLEGIVVSGAEKLAKPDPAIFTLTCRRYGLDPGRTVFIDDSPRNVTAAQQVGLTALHFTGAAQLRADLVGLGLLGEPAAVDQPVFHLAERAVFGEAQRSGSYLWSTRGVSYDQQGYVHLSFAEQVDGVRRAGYGDLSDDELVVLELDPARLSDDPSPLVVEDLHGVGPFPHLYAPLPLAAVVALHDVPLPPG